MTIVADSTVMGLLKKNSGVIDDDDNTGNDKGADKGKGDDDPDKGGANKDDDEDPNKGADKGKGDEDPNKGADKGKGGDDDPDKGKGDEDDEDPNKSKIVIDEKDNLFFDNPDKGDDDPDKDKGKAPVTASRFSEFENDEDFIALYELKKSKKGGFVDLAREIKIVDYENMTGEQLVELDCINSGVKDPDDIKIEVEAYKLLGPRAKQKMEGELRSAMIAKQDSELKAKVKGDYASSIENPEVIKSRLEKLDQSYDRAVNGMKGKMFLDMPIEESHITEFKTYVKDFIPKVLDKEGNLNIEIVRGIYLREKFLAEALAAIKGDARTEGRSNILKELGRFGKTPGTGSGQHARKDTKAVDNTGGNALDAFNKHRQNVQPGAAQVTEGLVSGG